MPVQEKKPLLFLCGGISLLVILSICALPSKAHSGYRKPRSHLLKSLSTFVSISSLESNEILSQHKVLNYFACIKSFDHLEIEVSLMLLPSSVKYVEM